MKNEKINYFLGMNKNSNKGKERLYYLKKITGEEEEGKKKILANKVAPRRRLPLIFN